MKNKTIEKNLSKVFDRWVESIEDEKVRKLVKNRSIITGGSIANMMINEKVNDYDIYFTDKKTVLAVAEYYIEKMGRNMVALHADHDIVKTILSHPLRENDEEGLKPAMFKGTEAGKFSYRVLNSIHQTFTNDEEDRVKIYGLSGWGTAGQVDDVEQDQVEYTEEDEKGEFIPKFISANAITLSDKIQLIIRFYGDAAKIHENFDFVHATSYWTSKDRKVVTTTEALECLMNRDLKYRGSKYPLASIFRSRKFLYRGWRINAGQYLKIAFQLNELDLKDPYTLEEQLTGVDLLYFYQIISDLTEKSQDKDWTPTLDYFIKIIERLFD